MTTSDLVGLVGILVAIGLIIWLAYRGFSLLLAAPLAALVAAAFSGEPLLAHWTQTLMAGAGRFIVQFFPLFLLGAVFGKLMDDSGSALAIARAITERMGAARAVRRGARVRDTYIRRRKPVRRVVRVVPRGRRALSRSFGSASTDSPAIALGSFSFT